MNATNIFEKNTSKQSYVPDRHSSGNRQIPPGEVDSPIYYGSPQPVDADIVIPIFNEEVQLADSVSTLCSFLDRHARDLTPFSWNIVIADNASTDASWQIAKSLCDWCPNQVRALHLTRKGRGYALKQAWLGSRATFVAYMDVDLSTDIGSTGSLILPLLQGGADIAFGSRLMPQSQVTRSPKREFISRAYNLMLRSYLAVSFHDAQCGFKAITAQAAHALLPQVKDDEWFFDTELLARPAGRDDHAGAACSLGGGCWLDGRYSRHGEEGSGRHTPGQGGYGGPSGRAASRRPGLPFYLGSDPPT